MIQILKGPAPVPLTDQIHAIVKRHGGRAVLIALLQALVRRRRDSLMRVSGVPSSLRRDVGLPPQAQAPPHWMLHR